MRRTYKVKEVFHTLQGEGFFAGTPSIFLRLSACNLWNGEEELRKKSAERSKAKCPLWCDTDFTGGKMMTAKEIVAACKSASGSSPDPLHVVVTGGEPALQMDQALVDELKTEFLTVAVETNGTVPLKFEGAFVTVSPKVKRSKVVVKGDEVKVVFPEYDPKDFEDVGLRRYVQPCDNGDERNTKAAVEWCLEHPGWTLSLQTHKILGLE